MRKLVHVGVLVGAIALSGVAIGLAVPAIAQPKASKPACGPEGYSGAAQNYVSVPCAPETKKTADGKAACGVEAYSAAEQKYVTVPCAAEAKKMADGKPACGPEAYSGASQSYVSVPCPAR